MTSSFQNVVGTPRDAVPDISKTNYLETAPDMTEAVNKQIDDNIRDTKEFFDQMVELEELAASKLDKRLAAIEGIVGTVGSILKKRRADEADDIGKRLTKLITEEIQEGAEEYQGFKNSLNLDNSKAAGAIDADPTLKDSEKLEIKFGLLSEEVVDLPARQRVKLYEDKISTVADVLRQNGALDSTTNAEFLGYGEKAILSWVRNVAYNEIEQGNDPTNPRFVRLLVKELGPQLKKQVEGERLAFQSTLVEKYKAEELYTFDTRIIESVKGAVIRSQETGKRLDETLYKDGGVIHQIAEQKFQGNREKATDYVFERVAKLVESNDLFPNEAREIYLNLPYERDGKVYDNYQEYVEKQTDGTGFKARSEGRIQRLSKAIQDIEKIAVDNENAARQLEANEFVNKQVIPRIVENKKADPPIDGLDESQAGALIAQYKQEPFYIDEVTTPVPQILLSYLNRTQTGGSRDKNVQNADFYAAQHNEADKRIEKMVARLETEDGNTASLTDVDLAVADKIKAEYREIFYGPDNKDLEIFEIAVGRGTMTYNMRRDNIMKELEGRYQEFKEDKNTVKLAEAGVQDVIKLRRQLHKKPELFNQPKAFKGEPVDDLFEFVQSGGTRNPELKNYYKALRIRVPDGKGHFRILGGEEAIYKRAVILKLQDPKTLKVDPDAQVLKDWRKENDMKTFPSEQKALRNYVMSDEETADFNTWLTSFAKQQGGDENTYTFVRNSIPMSDRSNLRSLSGDVVVDLADRGSTHFGMYKIPGEIILELDKAGLIDKRKRFDENAQSKAVIDYMNLTANRRSKAIRGAITKDNAFFGELINMSTEEKEAVNNVFPNLKKNYWTRFENVDRDVAKIIITDLEKAATERIQKRTEEKKRKDELRRKRDKKALRSGKVEPKPKRKEPTTMEELLNDPVVKKAREGR